MNGFTTIAVHGGLSKSSAFGTLRTPVYDSVAFEHESARSIQLTFEGKKPAHAYSRITNPSIQDLEHKVRLLSGGLAVLAVSSGMAAISNTILSLAGSGSNIVTTKNLFGNSLSLLTKTLAPWGLETKFIDMSQPGQIDEAIDANTCAVFMESITNPQLEVADCRIISQIAKKRGVPLIMDNTVMTPYLFNSKQAGVDIEILSSTKYISGGATSVGGLIIDNGTFDWSQSAKHRDNAKQLGKMTFISALRQEVYRNVGACMSPHTAYLQSLGLETMALRIDKSCENASIIARYLDKHPKVDHVHYPGLQSSKFHPVAARQFNNKFGGILTMDFNSQDTCFTFIDQLQIVRRATNINDNKTLILHPGSTIFAEYSETDKQAMGVRPTMVRLSVGIEDHQDLIDDLEKGLEAI